MGKLENMNHYKKYQEIIKNIGLKNIKGFIPYEMEQIIEALKKGDIHLNTLPIKKWDRSVGFVSSGMNTTCFNNTFATMVQKAKNEVDLEYKGGVSNSCCISTIKNAAVLLATHEYNFDFTIELTVFDELYTTTTCVVNYKDYLLGKRIFPCGSGADYDVDNYVYRDMIVDKLKNMKGI